MVQVVPKVAASRMGGILLCEESTVKLMATRARTSF
jgi:hypothetical protein